MKDEMTSTITLKRTLPLGFEQLFNRGKAKMEMRGLAFMVVPVMELGPVWPSWRSCGIPHKVLSDTPPMSRPADVTARMPQPGTLLVMASEILYACHFCRLSFHDG